MREIEFYLDRRGKNPVEDFLSGLAEAKIAKVIWVIDFLREHELFGEPYAKNLDGKLWELKAQEIRILFFINKRTLVFLHGFKKKTQKTPKLEKEIAINRMNDYLERSE